MTSRDVTGDRVLSPDADAFADFRIAVGAAWLICGAAVWAAQIRPFVMPVPFVAEAALLLIFQVLPAVALYLPLRRLRRQRSPRLRFLLTLISVCAFGSLALQFSDELYEQSYQHLPGLTGIAAYSVTFGIGLAISYALARYRIRSSLRFMQHLTLLGIPISVALLVSVILPTPAEPVIAPISRVPSTGATVPPVIVLVFDELAYSALFDGDGNIDRGRLPNFATVADQSLVLSNATANYFGTEDAVPTFASSLAPLASVADVRTYVQLGAADMRIRKECGASFDCRGAVQFARDRATPVLKQLSTTALLELLPAPLVQRAAAGIQKVASAAGIPTAPNDPNGFHLFTKASFDAFRADVSAGPRSNVVYLFHTLSNHPPYLFDESGNERKPRALTFVARGVEQDAAWDAYRTAIEYSDSLLGQLISDLKRQSMYEGSVLIITADHGLRRHQDGKGGDASVTRLMTQVPIIIHAPGVKSGTLGTPYQHIDLGRTVLDLVGLEAPVDAPGRSVFEPSASARRRWFLAEGRWLFQEDADGAWHRTRQVDRTHPFDAETLRSFER